MRKALFAWSGGKDSALALYNFREAADKEFEIAALLTTVTESYDRISMHGVRQALLEGQASSIGIPLEKVFISVNASNEEYEANMRAALKKHVAGGVSAVAFGDIFLEDLRRYREDKLKEVGLVGIFPIWKRDTASLARQFIKLGFKAIITCVDTKVMDKKFSGRDFDEKFLHELPSGVDPCGENGEFHSFVYDGPIFREKVSLRKGEVVLRDERFYYCDLLPA